MRQRLNGTTLFLALSSLLNACRTSVPPPIDVCIGDGFGGADCVLKDGSRAYRAPSELTNYWMTPQFDMQAFSQWCYDAPAAAVSGQMTRIRTEAGR